LENVENTKQHARFDLASATRSYFNKELEQVVPESPRTSAQSSLPACCLKTWPIGGTPFGSLGSKKIGEDTGVTLPKFNAPILFETG